MAEVGILTAFVFGAISFMSPCVLPLLPGYLSLMSGYSVGQLRGGETSPWRLLRVTLIFVAGFAVVFVALGAGATALGDTLRRNLGTLTSLAGWVVVAFGVLLVAGGMGGIPWLAGLTRDRRIDVRPSRFGGWAPLVMGLAFGFAWTPCIGPVLGAILTLAAVQQSVVEGMVLLAAFALGLGVPFVLAGLGLERMFRTLDRIRGHLRHIHVASGVLLAVFGILMIAGQMAVLSSWIQRLFTRIGLDFLATI